MHVKIFIIFFMIIYVYFLLKFNLSKMKLKRKQGSIIPQEDSYRISKRKSNCNRNVFNFWLVHTILIFGLWRWKFFMRLLWRKIDLIWYFHLLFWNFSLWYEFGYHCMQHVDQTFLLFAIKMFTNFWHISSTICHYVLDKFFRNPKE